MRCASPRSQTIAHYALPGSLEAPLPLLFFFFSILFPFKTQKHRTINFRPLLLIIVKELQHRPKRLQIAHPRRRFACLQSSTVCGPSAIAATGYKPERARSVSNDTAAAANTLDTIRYQRTKDLPSLSASHSPSLKQIPATKHSVPANQKYLEKIQSPSPSLSS